MMNKTISAIVLAAFFAVSVNAFEIVQSKNAMTACKVRDEIIRENGETHAVTMVSKELFSDGEHNLTIINKVELSGSGIELHYDSLSVEAFKDSLMFILYNVYDAYIGDVSDYCINIFYSMVEKKAANESTFIRFSESEYSDRVLNIENQYSMSAGDIAIIDSGMQKLELTNNGGEAVCKHETELHAGEVYEIIPLYNNINFMNKNEVLFSIFSSAVMVLGAIGSFYFGKQIRDGEPYVDDISESFAFIVWGLPLILCAQAAFIGFGGIIMQLSQSIHKKIVQKNIIIIRELKSAGNLYY